MNEEERQTQVSALFDGELDPAQSDFVVRRVLKDPALRAAWSRYAVIGATLRGEPLSVGSRKAPDVASRVARLLESEAPLLAPTPVAVPRTAAVLRGPVKAVVGAALAASVAAVSLLVLRMQGAPEAPASLLADVSSRAPAADADLDAPPSYTTPVAADGPGMSTPLVNYVVAHSEYLTPVMRFNPLSAVMMGSFEPGEELVEATEAEIGASRR